MKLIPHQKSLKTFLSNPENRKAYENLEFEFAIRDALMRARAKGGITQAQLAKKVGTKQSAIARFESGRSNPTVKFIQNLSEALGLKMTITVR